MPYVEVCRNGEVVRRESLDPSLADKGYRIRLGKGLQARLQVGQSATMGDYEVRIVADSASLNKQPTAPSPPGAPGTLGDQPTQRPRSAPRASKPLIDAPAIEGYEILGRLGEGGMGVVWHARQLGTNRPVALKLLGKGAFASDRSRLRFEREVELSARLEHPCIARIYDSGLHRGVYYYAMEHVQGVHLDKYVRRGNLSQRQVLQLMQAVCQAVQHAHQRGVIHRDLKPANVLVSEDGQPHVLDFGLARTFQEEDKGYTISVEGEISGTPAYMAPEQAAGRHGQMDTRVDVYTLGVILFRLLTGEHPHELVGSKYDVIRRIVEDEPRRPRDVMPSMDGELEALLIKALAKEPSDRYASAGELAEDIGNYLSGEPLRARPATTWYFLRKKIRKYRTWVMAGAAAMGVLVVLAVWAYVAIAHQRDIAEDQRTQAVARRVVADAEKAKADQAAQAERKARLDVEAKQREIVRTEGMTIAFRKAAAQARLDTAISGYATTVTNASSAWLRGDSQRSSKLLSECLPADRSWEWEFLSHLARLSHAPRTMMHGDAPVHMCAREACMPGGVEGADFLAFTRGDHVPGPYASPHVVAIQFGIMPRLSVMWLGPDFMNRSSTHGHPLYLGNRRKDPDFEVKAAALNPTRIWVALASRKRVWIVNPMGEMMSGSVPPVLTTSLGRIDMVAFSPDGSQLGVLGGQMEGGGGNRLLLFDINSLDNPLDPGFQDRQRQVEMRRERKWFEERRELLRRGLNPGAPRRPDPKLDLPSREVSDPLRKHAVSFLFATKDRLLFSTQEDKQSCLIEWDASSRRRLATYPVEGPPPVLKRMHPGGEHVLCRNGVYSLKQRMWLWWIKGTSLGNDCDVTADGKRVLVAAKGMIHVLYAPTGLEIVKFLEPEGVKAIAASYDGKFVAASYDRGPTLLRRTSPRPPGASARPRRSRRTQLAP